MSEQHDVIVKTYKGSQNQATRLFRVPIPVELNTDSSSSWTAMLISAGQ